MKSYSVLMLKLISLLKGVLSSKYIVWISVTSIVIRFTPKKVTTWFKGLYCVIPGFHCRIHWLGIRMEHWKALWNGPIKEIYSDSKEVQLNSLIILYVGLYITCTIMAYPCSLQAKIPLMYPTNVKLICDLHLKSLWDCLKHGQCEFGWEDSGSMQ